MIDDLGQWIAYGMDPGTFFSQCILVLEASHSYFKHIIQSRVLHLLRNNLKEHFAAESANTDEHYLECHIESVQAESPDHFLIRASMSGLAASLSGAHALCIHHDENPVTPEYYERIHRNIHHLLNLESGMYKGKDPMAGAYDVDYHTRQWTQKIWDQLSL
jgi:methylmalonyl-CoA mutase N-terminal domain/subunit